MNIDYSDLQNISNDLIKIQDFMKGSNFIKNMNMFFEVILDRVPRILYIKVNRWDVTIQYFDTHQYQYIFKKIIYFDILNETIKVLLDKILKYINFAEANYENFNKVIVHLNSHNLKFEAFTFKYFKQISNFSKKNKIDEALNDNDIELFNILSNIPLLYFKYGDLTIIDKTMTYNPFKIYDMPLTDLSDTNPKYQDIVIILKYLNSIPNYKSKLLAKIMEEVNN